VLTQEVTQYSRGSSVDEAVPLLSTLLEESATKRPDDRRVLFYLGDGEQTSSEKAGSFEGLAQYLDGGAVLGYGTEAGGRMLDFDGFGDANSHPEYILDLTASPPADALSHIDEKELRAIADDLGVPYVHREHPDGVDGVVSGMDPGSLQIGPSVPDPPVELYWWFAIPLGLILVSEAARAIGRLTRTTRGAA
jgi:Ca-activated chloride channel family protein